MVNELFQQNELRKATGMAFNNGMAGLVAGGLSLGAATGTAAMTVGLGGLLASVLVTYYTKSQMPEFANTTALSIAWEAIKDVIGNPLQMAIAGAGALEAIAILNGIAKTRSGWHWILGSLVRFVMDHPVIQTTLFSTLAGKMLYETLMAKRD